MSATATVDVGNGTQITYVMYDRGEIREALQKNCFVPNAISAGCTMFSCVDLQSIEHAIILTALLSREIFRDSLKFFYYNEKKNTLYIYQGPEISSDLGITMLHQERIDLIVDRVFSKTTFFEIREDIWKEPLFMEAT